MNEGNRKMSKFCILEEKPFGDVTAKNWHVDYHDGCSTGMTSANRPAPEDFLYDSREQAETDMQKFRADNIRSVETGKRLRKNKPVLSTFSVVEV
jgi:hypothetical protein